MQLDLDFTSEPKEGALKPAGRIIPDDVLRLQRQASDPDAWAWVTANAGSGKTYVLAQRVIRLLLDGVEPSKILCITFTKAAAANMANRVYAGLRGWIALDDAQLDAAIRAISSRRPDAAVRARARRLFAQALETPGGLKVQTIHAFCTRLLHQFPFEANVAARFAVMDEPTETQLLSEISLGVMLDAAADPGGPLGRALAIAITFAADVTFKEVVNEAIRKRDHVRKWTGRTGGVEAAIAELCGMLGIAADDTREEVENEIVSGPLLPLSQWAASAAIFATGSKNDQSQAARLGEALAASGATRTDAYLDLFLTSDRSKLRDSILTAGLAKKHPDFARRLADEKQRLQPLIERRKAAACRDRTLALLTIADAVIARYQAEKDRRGLLDYDDLIDKTLTLLTRTEAAWVHYKLDRGIDHVLIDEAQDTSPKQWAIVRLLVDEFFAGAGARNVKRTIFAVGDEKQSIFSFQGAAPREFEEMRVAFDRMCRAVEVEFRHVRFGYSFRSGESVLGAVDTVFRPADIAASITTDADGMAPHLALPQTAPGLVELWEPIKPDAKQVIEAWDVPFDNVTETSPHARLALRIAAYVRKSIERGGKAGDVLVLVRQRGTLFESIIRALKDAEIAVAGADRLVLAEHIAVMDLMVLADALLLADDDLALATVLKCPLFGFDDDDLFDLAYARRGSLRGALRAKVAAKPRYATAVAKLDALTERAAKDTPFAFFAHVLGAEHGRRQFLSRLGPEADDALNEFLNLAIDYESRETPSLRGFIAWLRGAQTDVKRDMEITRDEVRVMTVHGAKGLEAPVVILADTTTEPAGPARRQAKLLTLAAPHLPPEAVGPFVWGMAKATDVAPVAAARQRAREEAENEYRRLLYVAMTRAIDRLVICGIEGERGRPAGCWYDLVCNGLAGILVEEPAETGEGAVRRFRKAAPGEEPRAIAGAPVEPKAATAEPADWLEREVIPEVSAVALSPSRAYDESTLTRAAPTGIEREKALARGTAMHRLLQSLPDIPPAARAAAAERHLARKDYRFDADERAAMIAQVNAVLDDPRFAPLFAPGSRAEVPIVGRIARPDGPDIAVSGLIDRLAVTDEAVLIVDYKTNRPPPRRPQDAPAYVAQLALYRAVLTKLYPARPIRAALLWTEGPDLMEIPATMLDEVLTRVTSA